MQVIVKHPPAEFHHLAQNGDWIILHLLPDKAVSHFDALAKKPAAFFKISRSIHSRWLSLCKRLSSFSSSLRVVPSLTEGSFS
jgi:hypothetical protein